MGFTLSRKIGPTTPGNESVPLNVLFFLVVLAAGLIQAARMLGLLQFLEFAAYDQFLRMRAGSIGSPSYAAVVTIDDEDLKGLNWPVPDGRLNDIVTRALEFRARVVGLDVYRPTPQPPGSNALNQTLRTRPDVVGILRFPSVDGVGVAPPPAITSPHRIGFSDIPLDHDGLVRRALLYQNNAEGTRTSIALQTARIWLSERKIVPGRSPTSPVGLKIGAADLHPIGTTYGSYHSLDASGFQIAYDYRRRPDQIPVVRARDLLSGVIKPDVLDGRIVFIGITSQEVKDLFIAPQAGGPDRKSTYGVFLHAHAADQIVRQALGQSSVASDLPSPVETILILLGAALAAAVLQLSNRAQVHVALGLLGAMLIAIAAYAAFLWSWWIPVVPVVLSFLLSSTLVIGYRGVVDRRRRMALAGLLTNQVSAAVAQQLWQNRHAILKGTKPIPTRLTATVLFVDLAGSTTVADELPPEQVVDWISRFLAEMADAVLVHDGVVEKFTGDGLMAVFGIPIPRTDDAAIANDVRRACDTALDMSSRLDRLNREGIRGHLPYTTCRIGIHTGKLSAGNVGSRTRTQYTVIGQAANLAARLESYGKDDPIIANDRNGNPIDCRILISENTKSYLHEGYNAEEIGAIELRGAQNALKAFRLNSSQTRTEDGPSKPNKLSGEQA